MNNKEMDYKLLFESLPDLYLILDINLTIVNLSKAYEKVVMIDRKDVIGKYLFHVFPDNPENANATGVNNLHHSLKNVLKNKCADALAVQQYDIQDKKNNSDAYEVRYWSLVNTPVFNDKGEIIFIINRVGDVTEFVNLKKKHRQEGENTFQLKNKAQKMENEIYQRAQEIQVMNKNLQESYNELEIKKQETEYLCAKLENLISSKNDFFANISHEFRTPLTLILGHTQNILSSKLPQELLQSINLIDSNAKLLLKQVNDILDIAKSEAGKLQINYSETDISKIVRMIAEQFTQLAKDRNIHYEIKTPTYLIAQFDIDKIQRALLNLLSNAFKFTPDNGKIKCLLSSKNNTIYLRIIDNGKGIPKSKRKMIFNRFQQIQSGNQRLKNGTGLGLAIVKDFIELHGGVICVKDNLHGGATFITEIPIYAPSDKKIEKNIDANQFETLVSDHLMTPTLSELNEKPYDYKYQHSQDKNTILIVEDNIHLNNFIINSLQHELNVIRSFNGIEAINCLKKHKPDLILTDLMMPMMSGDELVKKIRSNHHFDDIPIILLTAKEDEELRVRLLREGIQDYISKPFIKEELKARINNLIHLKKMKEMIVNKNQILNHLNTELEAFNSMVTHDLRNPVNIIMGFSKLLLEMPLKQENHLQFYDYINEIYLYSKKMEQLIIDLLSLSRVKLESMKKTSVNLSELVKSILHYLSTTDPSRKTKFIIKDNIYIYANANLIKIALENILNNAWKYTSKNLLTIIEFDIFDENGSVYLIRDNGVGFPKNKASSLFKAFSRLHAEEDFPGTGIGLVIVKRIIERHGGKIWAESKDKGATFFIKMDKIKVHKKSITQDETEIS